MALPNNGYINFPPWLPKLEPLPKRFFSRINPEAPICAGHLRINRMKPKYLTFAKFNLEWLTKGKDSLDK